MRRAEIVKGGERKKEAERKQGSDPLERGGREGNGLELDAPRRLQTGRSAQVGRRRGRCRFSSVTSSERCKEGASNDQKLERGLGDIHSLAKVFSMKKVNVEWRRMKCRGARCEGEVVMQKEREAKGRADAQGE